MRQVAFVTALTLVFSATSACSAVESAVQGAEVSVCKQAVSVKLLAPSTMKVISTDVVEAGGLDFRSFAKIAPYIGSIPMQRTDVPSEVMADGARVLEGMVVKETKGKPYHEQFKLRAWKGGDDTFGADLDTKRVGTRVVTMEFDTDNEYGTPVRYNALCKFVLRASQPDEPLTARQLYEVVVG